MKRVTDNVLVRDGHSLPDTYRGCTHGLVRTTEGVVLVDTPMIPDDARAWRETISEFGDVRYLLYTHHHLDHTAGTYFFGGEGVAHAETKPRFEDQSSLFSQPTDAIDRAGGDDVSLREYVRWKVTQIDGSPVCLPDGYHVSRPSVYVTSATTLAVGEHTFELLHTPGHTAGDVGVYVPEEGVYFAGDTVTNGVYPSLSSSHPSEWLDSLARIQALDTDTVVPGHGEVGSPAMVNTLEQFLRTCAQATAEAFDSGLSTDQVLETVSFEAFMDPLHAGPERRRDDVARLLDYVRNEGSGR